MLYNMTTMKNAQYVTFEVRSTNPDVLAASSNNGILYVATFLEQAQLVAARYGTDVEIIAVHN